MKKTFRRLRQDFSYDGSKAMNPEILKKGEIVEIVEVKRNLVKVRSIRFHAATLLLAHSDMEHLTEDENRLINILFG